MTSTVMAFCSMVLIAQNIDAIVFLPLLLTVMKWNRLSFSILLLFAPLAIMADDSLHVLQSQESKYVRRVFQYRKRWADLIPTQFVIQNAGNMGIASMGLGWNYGGRKQWETDCLIGYIPRHQTSRGKLTMTVKENYIPWSLSLNKQCSIEPLTASIYLNTVYGHEFWKTQPQRYPDKYYDFMSTKFRLNIALGQRFTWHLPLEKRKGCKSISFFYEISTCDLYVRSIIIDSSVPLKDIIGLSLGIKLQTL